VLQECAWALERFARRNRVALLVSVSRREEVRISSLVSDLLMPRNLAEIVGQDGILRPIGNRPLAMKCNLPGGRLTIPQDSILPTIRLIKKYPMTSGGQSLDTAQCVGHRIDIATCSTLSTVSPQLVKHPLPGSRSDGDPHQL
jgi:hypothetical protein